MGISPRQVQAHAPYVACVPRSFRSSFVRNESVKVKTTLAAVGAAPPPPLWVHLIRVLLFYSLSHSHLIIPFPPHCGTFTPARLRWQPASLLILKPGVYYSTEMSKPQNHCDTQSTPLYSQAICYILCAWQSMQTRHTHTLSFT